MSKAGSVKVGVFGAGGRMGTAVCEAVSAAPGLELVAAVDPAHVGRTIAGITVSADPRSLSDTAAEVAVDFTVAAAARTNVKWCALHGVHAVVGTTGFEQSDLDGFRRMFTSSNCLVAANFAISAVLMMKFAEMAAPFFDTAEIIELHHDNKADAPSGTAVATAQRMAASSSQWAADPTSHEVYPGARGGRGPAGIRVHAVRMRGMVAHQEVILGAEGQTLTIRQDSYDRASFMPGVVLACRTIGSLPGLTIGLEAALGL
ncbi:MAG: 4-hydroxy-tetrahydrodipicolinate reductase [Ilumatobacteraceae bacterium]